jgi:hypothetical protein
MYSYPSKKEDTKRRLYRIVPQKSFPRFPEYFFIIGWRKFLMQLKSREAISCFLAETAVAKKPADQPIQE